MMKRFIILLLISPFVQNANVTKRKRLNTSILFEPIDSVDIAIEQFPKLTDVLPTLVQKTSLDYDNIPGVLVKNITIDIDKINIDKFRKKIDTIADIIGKDDSKANVSRRQAYLDLSQGLFTFKKASELVAKRKTLDLMLQTLYMARHKVRTLESSKYFNNKDTGFRIAFTYRRLSRIFRKMMRIYTYGNSRRYYYELPNAEIILHGKVTRLHVDFVYLWWVLIKVDGKYKSKTKTQQDMVDKSVLMFGQGGKPVNPYDVSGGPGSQFGPGGPPGGMG